MSVFSVVGFRSHSLLKLAIAKGKDISPPKNKQASSHEGMNLHCWEDSIFLCMFILVGPMYEYIY